MGRLVDLRFDHKMQDRSCSAGKMVKILSVVLSWYIKDKYLPKNIPLDSCKRKHVYLQSPLAYVSPCGMAHSLSGLGGSDARQTGDHEVADSTLAGSATFFRGD